LTTKNVYISSPYTDGHFRSLFYHISNIFIASEVLISTCTKRNML